MKKYMGMILVILWGAMAVAQKVNYGRNGIDKEGHIPVGINAGDKAPDFLISDSAGVKTMLSDVIKEQVVVIIFYRGVWCPVCIRYLSNLQDSLSLLASKGAKVIAVTPEVLQSTDKMRAYTGATFTIVSDQHEKIMRDYDVWFDVTGYYEGKVKVGRLTDIASNNGQEEARLPVPATYIIDRNGVIIYRYFDLDYRNRASVKDILDHLP